MENPIVNPRQFLSCTSQSYSCKAEFSQKKLSVERLKQAEMELGEDTSQLHVVIQKFRNCVQSMSLDCPTDSPFLLVFLRARKFNIDRAVKLLKNYINMRRNNRNLFNIPMSKMGHALKQEMQLLLPDKDKRGCPVFIFRAGRWTPRECSIEDIFRVNVALLETLVEDPETQITGVVCIVDMGNFYLSQARHFTPSYASKVISLIQDSFPIRFKGIHFVNEPFIFGMLFSMVLPFLSEKMKTRIYFHGSKLDALHNHVNPEILPCEYGGTKINLDTRIVFKSLET